jgi:cytochrome c-type biogenesis protein CcmH
MTLWFVFALMTAAAIFAVLWPLGQATNLKEGNDLVVYRDQLDEVERDRAAGRIAESEAQAARVEVSRRLIGAADAATVSHPSSAGTRQWYRRGTAVAAVAFLPVVATILYLALGSPQLPGQPLEERQTAAHQDRSR